MANLKEITGNRAEALAAYQALRKQMHDPTLTLISIVDLDIKAIVTRKKIARTIFGIPVGHVGRNLVGHFSPHTLNLSLKAAIYSS